MCSGKYNDIYFQIKITYPLVPYPHTYIARFAPFTKDGGMCHKILRAKREQRHCRQYTHLRGMKDKSSPRRSIAGPAGQVSRQEGQNNEPE